MSHRHPVEREAEILAGYERNHGNVRKTAAEFKLSRTGVLNIVRRAGKAKRKPLAAGSVDYRSAERLPLPADGQVKRYVFTAAQNNTRVHKPFLRNLEAFAAAVGAQIHVATFEYNKNAYYNVKSASKSRQDGAWYDPAILKYVSDERIKVAPGLTWCGEIQVLPTAVSPLSGFESYTGRGSGIFPHAKIAMESLPAMAGEGTKFNYTTGAVTLRNYIHAKAGLKAEFHHSYGALLVEVDGEGSWFCRHLNATSDGTFYDLDVKVSKGKVTRGHRVEAITWGDVHACQTDPGVLELGWGKGGMLDTLRPRYQFLHDLFDMRSRSHHEIKNPHRVFELHVRGQERVDTEIMDTADWLHNAVRPWCKSIVVNSNHDNHLERWLREGDYRFDPVNAEFFLKAQERKYLAIRLAEKKFNLLEWALREHQAPRSVGFLHEDESFIICPRAGGGIECGMHGDRGPNGARGSAKALTRLSRKSNVGHSHSARIIDGVYQAGTSSILRLPYVKGPSSHSHTHIVTYPNGKRALVTMYDNKWRAAERNTNERSRSAKAA